MLCKWLDFWGTILNQFASILSKDFPAFHFRQVYVLSLIDNGLDDVTGIASFIHWKQMCTTLEGEQKYIEGEQSCPRDPITFWEW